MGKVQHIKNGSDNQVSIILYQDGAPISMALVTQVQILVDDVAGTVIDSASISMDWTTPVDVNGQTAYPITFKGADANLPAGVYRDCEVRLISVAEPAGLVWPDPVTFTVED